MQIMHFSYRTFLFQLDFLNLEKDFLKNMSDIYTMNSVSTKFLPWLAFFHSYEERVYLTRKTLDGKLYHNVCHVQVILEVLIEAADGFRDNK